jgi:sugar phosphate isomerase/epimerase
MDGTPMPRRAFLGAALAAAGGGTAAVLAACAASPRATTATTTTTTTVAAGGAGAAAAAGARVPGVQLYTLRSLLEKDFEGTLRAVAEIGYKELEFAGYYNRPPAALRATLDALGLRAPAAHLPLDAFRAGLPATLDAASALGHQYLVCPFLLPPDRTAAAYGRLADEFNGIGRACQARGMRFAYHNHDFEFADLGGGRTGFDILLAGTDPALVQFELDLYWATRARRDPVALFAANPGRFPLCHVKDLRDPQGTQAMAPVGEGTIDFARVFARAPQAGLRHYFVEHDTAAEYPGGPLASLRASYGALRRLLA